VEIDRLSNIAVIGRKINIRISDCAPAAYVKKFDVTAEKLAQQFIEPDFVNVQPPDFAAWTERRAQRLADEANAFMAELKAGC